MLVFISRLGTLSPREHRCSSPVPVPQGHTASCSGVRDGTQVFKTQSEGSGQWLRREPPALDRLSLLPWGLHAWAAGWAAALSFPAAGDWGRLR